MIIKIFRHSLNVTKILLETLAIFATVAVLAAAILFWRLSQGPFDVSFAQSYIETALADRQTGLETRLPNVVLSWPALGGPLMLEAKNVEVVKQGHTVFKVTQARIGLSTLYLFVGRIVPTSVELNGPTLQIIRQPDNQFTLGWANSNETAAQDAGKMQDFFNLFAQTKRFPDFGITRRSPLTHLQLIHISNARLSLEDRIRGATWTAGQLDFTFSRLWNGLNIEAHMPLVNAGAGHAGRLDIQAIYHQRRDDFDVIAHFVNFNPQWLAHEISAMPDIVKQQNLFLNGTAHLHLDQDLHLAAVKAQIAADNTILNLPILYTHGLPLNHLALALQYDAVAHQGAIDNLELQMAGITAAITMPFSIDDKNMQTKIALLIPQMPQATIAMLWPDAPIRNGVPPGAVQRWVGQKMSAGVFKNIHAAIDLSWAHGADGQWQHVPPVVNADFDVADMDIDYHAPLTPARHVDAHVHLANNIMDVAINQGTVGAMRVSKGNLRIDHVGAIGTAALNLTVDGQLPGFLSYIAAAPINLNTEQWRLAAAQMQGDASFDIALSLPTVKDLQESQINLGVRGVLRHILSRSSNIAGTVAIQADYKAGAAGQMIADVKVDATQANIVIPIFSYIKKMGAPAMVQARAFLEHKKLAGINALNIQGPNLQVAGGKITFADGGLRNVELPHIQLNETRAAVALAKNAAGQWHVDVQGPFIDISPFLNHKANNAPYKGPPFIVHLVADQMRTATQHIVQHTDALVDMGQDGLFNRIDVRAVAGTGPVQMQLAPDAQGMMHLHLSAADAGAALQDFNIYDHALGGTLQIDGAATDPQHKRDIAGIAMLRDFRVVHGPVLARIISAISPLSLIKSLDGDGIGFSMLQSKFGWSMRSGGDLFILSDGHTSGNSLGLTFAGTIDKQKNAVAMEGDVIPLSGLNGLIGHIPILGNLLTGNENGALFAATYTVSGPVSAPSVDVNPLSVLAPGIFRRILFGGE